MSFALIGGVFLNLGAYLTFKGKIYEAVIVYMFADLCWIVMAWERDDFWGMLSIIFGVTFGFLAFLKMQKGELRKDLNNSTSHK